MRLKFMCVSKQNLQLPQQWGAFKFQNAKSARMGNLKQSVTFKELHVNNLHLSLVYLSYRVL